MHLNPHVGSPRHFDPRECDQVNRHLVLVDVVETGQLRVGGESADNLAVVEPDDSGWRSAIVVDSAGGAGRGRRQRRRIPGGGRRSEHCPDHRGKVGDRPSSQAGVARDEGVDDTAGCELDRRADRSLDVGLPH